MTPSAHDSERLRVIGLAIKGDLTPYECLKRLKPIARAEHRDTLKRRRAEKVEREERARIEREQAEIRRLGDELRQQKRQERRDTHRSLSRYEELPGGA